MNWDQVAGGWKKFRGQIQEQWGRLTDDDLDVIDGKHDQLVGTIQQKYGMAREDAERSVQDWLRPLREDI